MSVVHDTFAQRLVPVIKQIKQQKQTQVSLTEQLDALAVVAEKLGMYDAADFIRKQATRK